MAMTKNKRLNNGEHAGMLRKMYPQGKVISIHPKLIWECAFSPTPLSKEYNIRLIYHNGIPNVFVINMELSKGVSSKLPHVYSTKEQSLCLHYPLEKAWTPAKNIADTIIPWAAEWLFHYEVWVVTGEWNGGGTIH